LQKLGLALSRRDAYKRYSRPQPEADDVLQAPAPQPQQSAPGGDAVGASPFSERVRRFCMEGENKGMPGVCPEHKATDSHKDALQTHASGLKGKLSSDEKGALDDYVAGLDEPINEALRAGKEITDRDEKAIVKGLDSILVKAPPLPAPVNVHRGVRLKTPEQRQAFLDDARAKAASGQPLTFGGYSSTTTDPAVADKFLRGNTDAGLVFDIEARHGVSVGELTGTKQGQAEAEFLLPRGQQFDVLGVEDGGPGQPARVRIRQRAEAAKSSERAGATFADASCAAWFARRPL
jgi:hypothetical protein